MDYLLLKFIHIISATIIFGTGLGSAFFMFAANKQKNVKTIYFITNCVVIADFIFTAPTVIIQFITGLWLANIMGYNLNDQWLFWGLVLYFFAGLCWLPVVWIQIKMRVLAKEACEQNKGLPDKYWKIYSWWIALGSLAFPAVMVIFYLMINKS